MEGPVEGRGAQELRAALRAAGPVGRDLLEVDWEGTPLGRPESWSSSLRTVVQILLGSRFSMWMAWGPELTFFCNDAYRRDTLGEKYPWALGRPAREVWSEIWPEIGPRIETVLRTGEATWDESLFLVLERSGYEEETYHTFSYSPLPAEDGSVAGMLCVVTEDTERVVGERRMTTLRDLGNVSTTERDEEIFLRLASEQLAADPRSLPFTAVYLFEPGGRARLAAATGLAAGDPAAPETFALGASDAAWPVGALADGTRERVVIDGLAGRFPWLPAGAWSRPPRQALAISLPDPTGGAPFGCIIVGVNPYRPLDEGYESFVALIAQRLASGVASARAYAAERHRAEELAELDRAKTAFFSNVSHEFRTPLTLMLAPLQDAIEARDGLEPDQVELVHRNGLRLLKLVGALLDFSRVEAGRLRAQFRPVQVDRLTAELVGTFSDACERAGIELVIRTEEPAGEVFLDPDLWERIVLNLVSNAFKFTLRGRITVELDSVEDRIVLSVSDTGAGIPADELERVFERFHRSTVADARSHEGTGIGLALVKELVELHGGEISARSVQGEGATFLLTLPLGCEHLPPDQVSREPADTAPGVANLYSQEAIGWLPESAEVPRWSPNAAPAPAGRARGRVDTSRARVLIADDNPDLRRYLARLLAPQWETEAVDNGAEALERIRRAPPDLLVTDVMMPGLDGFELLAAVRADPQTRELPVIMLSARAGEEASIEGLEAGADDYLPKPFSGRELLARVRAHLELSLVRRQAAEDVRAERQLLEQTLDQMPAGVLLAEAPSGRLMMANQQVGEMLGQPVAQAADIDDVGASLQPAPFAGSGPLVRAIRNGEVVHDEDVLHRDPDGRQLTLRMSAAPIQSDEDETVAGVAVFQDITDRVRSERLLASQRDILAMIARGVDLDQSLDAIARATEQLAERECLASILLVSDDGRRLVHGAAPHLPPEYRSAIDGLEIGPVAGSCGTAVHRRETVVVEDTLTDPLWVDLRELAAAYELRACWSTPILATDGEIVGTFAIYHHTSQVPSAAEHQLVELLARTAAVAVERERDARARERETRARLRQLAELQTSLLPRELPTVPSLQLAAGFHPSDRTLEVGGDFYDVFELPGDSWGLLMGDVCGHGAEAAAVTALTRHTTRAIARLKDSPGEVLADVSQALLHSDYGRYCTAVLGRLSMEAAGVSVSLAVGGHPQPIIRRADGTVESLREHGPVLGLMPDCHFPEIRVLLHPGDALILYTDGLIERNPRITPDRELPAAIGALGEGDADALLADLEAAVLGAGPYQLLDDVAVLVVRVEDGERSRGRRAPGAEAFLPVR